MPRSDARRLGEVAVDAVGPQGGQTFTYHLPELLIDLVPGEAVLVEYGQRNAVGIVVGAGVEEPLRATKPVLARIRSDGPLLPPLQVELARHVATHYLAPMAMVLRAMLAPGMLERVERVVRPAADGGGATVVEWQVRPAEVREKRERHVRINDVGTEQVRAENARLGPRQRAALEELVETGDETSAARLAERHGSSAIRALVKRGLVDLVTVSVERRPRDGRPEPRRGTIPIDAELTAEQERTVERVRALVGSGQHATLLIEGAAASGKSAIYAAAIRAALDAGRSALVLVPEIALVMPLLERLQHDVGTELALLHSALSEGERGDEWRRIRSGEARVVVGTRIAVLAPLADVGVIVVDEEHDAAYKSERTPRYQARDLAVELGRLAAAPVLLGSATPDVVSLGRARRGDFEHFRLPERVAGTPPSIEIVDLRAELGAGNRGLLSRRLADALSALDTNAGDQAILLINRRGAATVVVCRDCGYVQICPECQRPLVFHSSSLSLRCHHCGATAPVARRCPACDSPRIRYLGGGTERVEREVTLRFPQLRVGRLDRDVVERRGGAVKVMDEFAAGDLDVLVGTALVAKGIDVPQVTLVGVVSADVSLNLPDERAAERTYQLLAQAVGRAGRGERPGTALIQTYIPDHPVIHAVASGNAGDFYDSELESRQRFRSPPFGEIVKLTVALEDRDAAQAKGGEMADTLRQRATDLKLDAEVLGPVPAYIARRGGKWRFHVVIRGTSPLHLLGGDPGVPWSVDVDPESLL
ncbi:MAG: replication restart helicase PriA [Candidatus Limnocylindrales bacterium]